MRKMKIRTIIRIGITRKTITIIKDLKIKIATHLMTNLTDRKRSWSSNTKPDNNNIRSWILT